MVADDGWLARLLIERLLGAIYLVAFGIALRQFPALCGERGLERSAEVLRHHRFLDAPSVFWWGYTDRRLRVVAWTGIALSAATIAGIPAALPLPVTMLAWFVLWALYLSVVHVGQLFWGYGWETQLCETGFLAIFLCPVRSLRPFPARPPPPQVLWLFRWLIARMMLGAGLIKLRGDPCWRDALLRDPLCTAPTEDRSVKGHDLLSLPAEYAQKRRAAEAKDATFQYRALGFRCAYPANR
jgi:hypothetical protein